MTSPIKVLVLNSCINAGGAGRSLQANLSVADPRLKAIVAMPAPGVLQDYIASGTETHGAQRRLSFEREVETAIYNTLPHQLARRLRAHPLRCGMAFIQGSDSTEIRQVGLRATARAAQGRISTITGSHLFPLEHPRETATEVLRWIAALAQAASTPRL